MRHERMDEIDHTRAGVLCDMDEQMHAYEPACADSRLQTGAERSASSATTVLHSLRYSTTLGVCSFSWTIQTLSLL